MSYIERIRSRLGVGPSARSGTSSDVRRAESDLPLDHQLTFKRDHDETWSYRDGHIFINDVDVEGIIDYDSRDVGVWFGVIEGLTHYKSEVKRRGVGDQRRFFARVHAIHDTVAGNIRHFYNEKTAGFSLSMGNGEVLLNNFNVRAFLAMYHVRPTPSARKFLIGLKSKLALILVNRGATREFERVHGVISELYEEVLGALQIPPMEARCLPSSLDSRSL